MKWPEMSESERDALIHKTVMGRTVEPCVAQQGGPLDAEQIIVRCERCGHEFNEITSYSEYGPDAYARSWPHNVPIPPYTTSMDAAWLVLQKMAKRWNNQAEYLDEPYAKFVDELLPNSGGEIWTAWKCMANDVAKWTPEAICYAAYEAVPGQEEL